MSIVELSQLCFFVLFGSFKIFCYVLLISGLPVSGRILHPCSCCLGLNFMLTHEPLIPYSASRLPIMGCTLNNGQQHPVLRKKNIVN